MRSGKQFLDAILEIPSLTVDLLVEPLWTLLHVGHHEARIVLGFLALRPHHLRFINDATFPWPGLACPVLTLTLDMLGLSRDLRFTTSAFHVRLSFAC